MQKQTMKYERKENNNNNTLMIVRN